MDDYPLDRPLWGLAEVWGKCRQVKAEICSGESCIPCVILLLLYQGDIRLLTLPQSLFIQIIEYMHACQHSLDTI